MDEITFNLLKFMKESFGELGYPLLLREVKKLGYDKKTCLTDSEKETLVNHLVDNVFYDYSSRKQSIVKAHLISLLKFSEKTLKSMNDRASIGFLIGRPD